MEYLRRVSPRNIPRTRAFAGVAIDSSEKSSAQRTYGDVASHTSSYNDALTPPHSKYSYEASTVDAARPESAPNEPHCCATSSSLGNAPELSGLDLRPALTAFKYAGTARPW